MAPVFVANKKAALPCAGPEGRGPVAEPSPPDDNAASPGL
jgi:hypothetical protein